MDQTSHMPPWPGPEAPAPPPYPGPPPPQRKTSGFAIASFVFGLIGGVLLSVVFGIIALRRIKRQGLDGKGFAIAGLVLSGLWTLLIAAVIVLALTTGADRDPGGRVTDSGSESVFDLRTGDCMNDLEETPAELSVDVAPCGEPHDAEAVSEFDLTESVWPGLSFVTSKAEDRCLDDVESASAGAPRSGEIETFYFHPIEQSWEQGDRTVLCVAIFPSPRRGAL
jgi:hypothetical protein